MTDNILFFSVVDDSPTHQEFVFSFIASALIIHPGAACEVLIPNSSEFVKDYVKEIEVLCEVFPDRAIRVRPWSHILGHKKFLTQSSPGAFIRFLSCPDLMPIAYHKLLLSPYQWKYTYISDIDMLFVDDILPDHKAIMGTTGFPYTNIIRPNTNRLTGCMMVKSKEYYDAMTPVIKEYIDDPESIYYPINSDEKLLYHLIDRSPLPLPNRQWGDALRPSTTIHTSPNREIDMGGDWRESPPHWGLTPDKLKLAKTLFATPEWQAMVFPKAYQENFLNPIMERIEMGEVAK